MLTIEQISKNFPLPLRQRNPRGMLVEYLQYELLDSLFKNPAAAELSFIGGTAIRILYDSPRFSEDLDFDNFGLSFSQFEELLKTACRDMEYKGFLVEYRVVEKGAWHCYIRFPKILHEAGLSPDVEQKILIRIDSEEKEKLYDQNKVYLNGFTVYRQLLAAPAAILLAQKMTAILYRKREKGRDIFDVSFLSGLTAPDFGYIERLVGMDRPEFLRHFEERLGNLDLNSMARDVEPFLFAPEQRERVATFRDFWNNLGRSC
jgi:predicted nucleotidyltransferase component of viral defense system